MQYSYSHTYAVQQAFSYSQCTQGTLSYNSCHTVDVEVENDGEGTSGAPGCAGGLGCGSR